MARERSSHRLPVHRAVVFEPDEFVEDPNVTFFEPGGYVLRLTADDGEKIGTDDIFIMVDIPGCCPADIADAAATLGVPDGQVGFGDLGAFISALAPTFADIPVGTIPPLDCMDIADAAATLGVPDGQIGFGDLGALIVELSLVGFADRDCVTDPLY